MTRQRLAPMDTLFLRMEDPTNPMMVTGVMVFGSPVDPERLRETIETRLLVYDRFRQRVAFPRPPRRTPYWQDDPDFDLGYHLRRVTLPPPGERAAAGQQAWPADPDKMKKAEAEAKAAERERYCREGNCDGQGGINEFDGPNCPSKLGKALNKTLGGRSGEDG